MGNTILTSGRNDVMVYMKKVRLMVEKSKWRELYDIRRIFCTGKGIIYGGRC